jgi:hypothetical protein
MLSSDNFCSPIEAGTKDHRIEQSDSALLESAWVFSLQLDQT